MSYRKMAGRALRRWRHKHRVQLDEWVAGRPKHIGRLPNGTCCPDFSCCSGHPITPVEGRVEFRRRYLETGEAPIGMLMTFLSRAIEREGMGGKVHIAGRADG